MINPLHPLLRCGKGTRHAPLSARRFLLNGRAGAAALFAGILLAATPAFADLKLYFGLYTSDKPTTVVRMFTPLIDALEAEMSRKMGEPVSINIHLAKTYEQGLDDLVTGKVDFARFGSISYVLAKQAHPALRLLVTESHKGEKRLSGVIAVRADSPIQSVGELKGKAFAFGNENSTTGRYLSQLYLLENGIHAKDLERFEYLHRHDAVAAAVAQGRFDVRIPLNVTACSTDRDRGFCAQA